MALAITANKFASRPSDLLGILDRVIALDLDTAAALRLHRFEQQIEQRRMEGFASIFGWSDDGEGAGNRTVDVTDQLRRWIES